MELLSDRARAGRATIAVYLREHSIDICVWTRSLWVEVLLEEVNYLCIADHSVLEFHDIMAFVFEH